MSSTEPTPNATTGYSERQGHSGDVYRLQVEASTFIVLTIISLLIITTNAFTIAVIACTSRLKNVTGHLMISLAVADLGVGVMTSIPLLYAAFSDRLTPAACDVIGFLSSVCWVVSVYTLMLLSVDRLVAIVRPLQFHMLFTKKRCLISIGLTWIASSLIWILPLFDIGSYKFNHEEVTCYFDVARYPWQWITYMLIIFIPSGIVMAISYTWIWLVAKKQRSSPQDGTLKSEALTTAKKNFKALRTLIIIVGAFYVAWLPFIIEHVTKAAIGSLHDIPEWLEITIYMIAITNSFWNPLIYITTNRTFRLANLKLIIRLCPSCICIRPKQVGGLDITDVDLNETANQNRSEP